VIYTDQVKDDILEFLQTLFGQEELYSNPTTGGMENKFLWNFDHTITKILITDQYPQNLEANEKRPWILVARAPIKWAKISNDQFLSYNLRSGSRYYTDLLTTGFRINCFSRNGLEAEFLATLVFQGIQFFSQALREKSHIFDVSSVSIGEESIVKSDSKIDLTVVPVDVAMTIQDKWMVQQDGTIVNSIGLKVNYGSVLPNGKNVGQYETDP